MSWKVAVLLLGCAVTPAGAFGPWKGLAARAERLVSLREFASHYGFTIQSPPGKKFYLRSPVAALELETDSREMRFNGLQVWLNAPLTRSWGRWCLSETDVQKVLHPLLYATSCLRGYEVSAVLLDPGHGGLDQGTTGRRGVEEKKLTLDIARRVRAQLINEGLHASLTRDVDRFVELDARARLAGQRGANLFVSIHLNSAPNPASRGVETYVLTAAGYPSSSGRSDHLFAGSSYPANCR